MIKIRKSFFLDAAEETWQKNALESCAGKKAKSS